MHFKLQWATADTEEILYVETEAGNAHVKCFG